MILNGKRGPSADLIAGIYLHYSDHMTWLLTGEENGDDCKNGPGNVSSGPPYPDLVGLFQQQELARNLNRDLLTLERLDQSELEEVCEFVKYRLFRKEHASKTNRQ